MARNTAVRRYWEAGVCGGSPEIIGALPRHGPEWFERIQRYRYATEPFIHAVAQFTRYHGKRVLEIGVGAGTDHLQWARAGAECYGVDLTQEAIETTAAHLALHGFRSQLQRVDAERLPLNDAFFDVVYSWGAIHHSEHPERILAEVRRVLKPGGMFIGMLYNRYSLLAWRTWVRHALLAGRPWRSLSDVVYHHVESVGTKAFTIRELQRLFADFTMFSAQKMITAADRRWVPRVVASYLPNRWGLYVAIRAVK